MHDNEIRMKVRERKGEKIVICKVLSDIIPNIKEFIINEHY